MPLPINCNVRSCLRRSSVCCSPGYTTTSFSAASSSGRGARGAVVKSDAVSTERVALQVGRGPELRSYSWLPLSCSSIWANLASISSCRTAGSTSGFWSSSSILANLAAISSSRAAISCCRATVHRPPSVSSRGDHEGVGAAAHASSPAEASAAASAAASAVAPASSPAEATGGAATGGAASAAGFTADGSAPDASSSSRMLGGRPTGLRV
eukprot:scaffold32349_cov56-Phaeocystis_antarctica.AAC.4